MKHQDMEIGSFLRFNYESTSPQKKYKNPVKVNLADARRMEIIASVQKGAAEGEKRFKALLAQADVTGGLTDLTLEHAKLEAVRPKGGKRTARQVELSDMIKAEWQRLIGSKKTGETMSTAEGGFYRQYKAERIEENPEGRIYGCLVNKSISQSGEILFTFLRLAPATVESEFLESLNEIERAKLVTV
jgi:hypothetical protein